MLNRRVAAWKKEPFVPVFLPPHKPRRPTVHTMDFQDLSVPVGLANMVALDNQSIPNLGAHWRRPFLGTADQSNGPTGNMAHGWAPATET